jgi:hypothetical protein
MADRHGATPSARRSKVVSATTNQTKVTNPMVMTKDRKSDATVFGDL